VSTTTNACRESEFVLVWWHDQNLSLGEQAHTIYRDAQIGGWLGQIRFFFAGRKVSLQAVQTLAVLQPSSSADEENSLPVLADGWTVRLDC
jgi:hypothetical protein